MSVAPDRARHTDLAPDHWTLRALPPAARPYARLARLDRPVGWQLLFWPCAAGAALAGDPWPDPLHLLLFLAGAIVMRGAGCTLNDILDRDLDARVTRTAGRPLPAGEVTVRRAVLFLAAQLLAGLCVLLAFNSETILLGAASLVLVGTYPLMKRITWWPQLFLGLAFSWGALVGYTAGADGWPSAAALWLYAGCVLWVVGYDTIYAHQDLEDDAAIGVRSTARLFGGRARGFVAVCYALGLGCWTIAWIVAGSGFAALLGLGAAAALLALQGARWRLGDPTLALRLFKSNVWVGAALTAAVLLGQVSA